MPNQIFYKYILPSVACSFAANDTKVAGIYLHIPFCKQACTYCNFHFSTSLQMKDDMIAAILRELEVRRDYLPEQTIETIYFGGGTPSVLSADEIKQITEQIYKLYKVENLKEFTLEANPDDLTAQYLKELRDTAISRFSIGVQSFRDEDLQYMNRAHNAQQADRAIKTAQDAGFSNLTIDLIYGTPGLTDADWKYNLGKIKTLGIPHFSSYALTVEEGTLLHHNIKRNKTTPVDPAQAAGQFEILMAAAADMGYDHYEISNLALPGHHAVHNTNYWMGVPYIGIGPSAHSYNLQSRSWNIANNALYIKSMLTENTIPLETETLTTEQQLNEYLMTSLRTMWGCDMSKIATTWGTDYSKQILHGAERFAERGQLLLKDNKLILTDAGKLFADSIASELFV